MLGGIFGALVSAAFAYYLGHFARWLYAKCKHKDFLEVSFMKEVGIGYGIAMLFFALVFCVAFGISALQ